jgi:hypothetical protein
MLCRHLESQIWPMGPGLDSPAGAPWLWPQNQDSQAEVTSISQSLWSLDGLTLSLTVIRFLSG